LPLVQTTRGQALAMYVVYESPLVSLADSPDAYEGQAGLDFLRTVPTTWDETHFIAGDIAQFVVIARRNRANWFVGAMTNEAERTLTIPLAFLEDSRFLATIYSDGDTPTALTITQRTVGRQDIIELRLAPSGGAAIAIKRFVD
jgi:alpha-glucosidase